MKRYTKKYVGLFLAFMMLMLQVSCGTADENQSKKSIEVVSLEVEVVALPGPSESSGQGEESKSTGSNAQESAKDASEPVKSIDSVVVPIQGITVESITSITASSEPASSENSGGGSTPSTGTSSVETSSADAASTEQDWLVEIPQEGQYYYDLQNVVLYLYFYEELPDNYLTKSEARKLGWEGGSVEKYKEGAAIGGDTFGNREGLLPKEKGRTYTECDIDTEGEDSRGAKRLVFSNDGLFFYTEDHYESFDEVTVSERYEVIW